MFQGRWYCFVEGTGTLKSDRPGFEFELCQSLTLRPSADSFMSQAHFPHPSNEGVCLVAKLGLTLCDPTDCSTSGLPVLHYLPGFAQIHVHWVSDAIKPSHPLPPFPPPAFSLSQHQGLFQWVSSSHLFTFTIIKKCKSTQLIYYSSSQTSIRILNNA